MVVILKVTLPLVALGVLSSLFLFSRPIDPDDAIPYANVEIADRLAKPRMTGAGYATVTSDGSTLTLSADQAAPNAIGAEVTAITATLASADGVTTEITAGKGKLDRAAGQFSLTGGVRVATSAGYQFETDGLMLATDRTSMESTAAITATLPAGSLTAGGMRMTKRESDNSTLLVFNKGVRLIYVPKN